MAAFDGDARGVVAMNVPEVDLPFIRPAMEFGVASIPAQPAAVIVQERHRVDLRSAG